MDETQTNSASLSRNTKAMILYIILLPVIDCSISMIVFMFAPDFLHSYKGYFMMYFPGLAALIASRFYRGTSQRLGVKRCKLKYLALGAIIPILYGLLAYGIYWISFPGTLSVAFQFVKTLPFWLSVNIFFAFGEEIGWRGFLTPFMTAKFGYVKGSLLVGIIWGLWHNPFYWGMSYGFSFMICTITLTFIMNYLTLRSNSVWPAVLIHGIHNYLLFKVLDPITGGSQKANLLGESGTITISILVFATVAVLLIHRKFPVSVPIAEAGNKTPLAQPDGAET